jgi:metal transporter CNNM
MASAAGRTRAASLAAAVRVVAPTARPASSAAAAAGVSAMALIVQGEDTAFGSLEWWVYAGISCFLVLFAGIMSGLTLGLMSLGLVELEILQRSGTDAEKAQAGPIQNPIYFPLSTSLCSIWLLLSE